MYPGIHAATSPDRLALIMAESGETFTYAQLDAGANRVSRVFREAGLSPGDHVAWCLENHRNFLELVWGAYYAGLIYTPISSRSTAEEIAYIVKDCGARAFVTSGYKAAEATELADKMSGVGLKLMMDETVAGYDPYEEAVAAALPEPLEGRVSGNSMLYSSGTTGRPKGVLTEHEAVPLEEAESVVAMMCVFLLRMSHKSVYLSPAPLYHGAPLRFTTAAQIMGATAVVMERFDAREFLAAVERYSVTHAQVVPTMFVRLLKLPDEQRLAHDLSSLTRVVHAAAPCPVEAKHQMIDWLGPIISEYYAGTEGSGFTYCDSEQWLAHPGTVGRPIGTEVHIIDDATGAELPTGEEGVVYFGTGSPADSNPDDERTTSGPPDDWSCLGDIGRVDDDGFLYLTDRQAYKIISGGVNVYPQEAENLLTMHPAVYDVAVFGVPDDDLGEVVKAVVQPEEMPVGVEAAAALERDLIDYCRASLASVKCPRSVDFREELPRDQTGKLFKRLLKDEYWQGRGQRI